MLFTPNYTVSYKGVFHPAGKPFDIDPKDRNEMERHGKVVEDTKPVQSNEEIIEAVAAGIEKAIQDKPAKKGGRPRKVSA